MEEKRNIPFSPPDISEAEIEAVAEALRSGWITTGPKTKLFERELTEFTGAQNVACLNSATAALECALRALGVGPGDEVITSAYTYTASCSVIYHVGATPILCDTALDSYEMDYDLLEELITEKTKVIIPVDIAGRMCDYQKIYSILEKKKNLWKPVNEVQSYFDRVIVLADAAHSLGATYHGQPSGSVADFTAFSFHAVKNLTTAEGGALTWRAHGFDSAVFYQHIMRLSLHGQTKDALSKTRANSWEYDIAFPGWKCNMTDIQAALGLTQLRRYSTLLARRRELVQIYEAELLGMNVDILSHAGPYYSSSCHLMLVRLNERSESFRNEVIKLMAEDGVMTNVHYKPLPLFTAYKNLGFNIQYYPNALAQYQNEITLPLYSTLTNDDLSYVVASFKRAYANAEHTRIKSELKASSAQPLVSPPNR